MPTIKSRLMVEIAKLGGQKVVAYKLGPSEAELSRKMNGVRGWLIDDLDRLFDLLNLQIITKGTSVDDKLISAMGQKIAELSEINESQGKQIAQLKDENRTLKEMVEAKK